MASESEKRNKRRMLHRDGIPARVILPSGHVHPWSADSAECSSNRSVSLAFSRAVESRKEKETRL